MFVVWVAVRQIAPDDLKVLVRTLMRVFPHTTMWLDGYYLAMVSTVQPPAWDAEPIQHRFREEAFRNALDEAAVDSALSLLATFVAGPEALDQYAGSGPLNTEDRPIIEFRTPRQGDRLNTKELAAEIFDVLHLYQEPLCPTYVAAEGETRSRLEQAQEARWTARRGLVEASRGRHVEAAKLFGRALAIDPADDLARYEMEAYSQKKGPRLGFLPGCGLCRGRRERVFFAEAWSSCLLLTR
jgi:spermidine synthase